MNCDDCGTELELFVPAAKLMFSAVYRCPDCGERQLDAPAPDG